MKVGFGTEVCYVCHEEVRGEGIEVAGGEGDELDGDVELRGGAGSDSAGASPDAEAGGGPLKG